MRKIMNWVLAATLICGASVFTSCSANDVNDNPSQEQAKMITGQVIKVSGGHAL